jgi:hypothetical protein
MGLLFVFENDDTAKGPNFDLGLDAHLALTSAARAVKGGFPLVRRLSEYYRDVAFDLDELEPLIAELSLLRAAEPTAVDALLEFTRAAISENLGLLVICD